jgi:ABC-type lipoprotein export system ATPase subunit
MNSTFPQTAPKTAERDSTAFDKFLKLNHLPPRTGDEALENYWEALPWEEKEESGMDLDALRAAYHAFLERDDASESGPSLTSLTILRGQDKSGRQEKYDLTFRPGDIICIVGPTGAGKSRFLADIECLAQGDTPTKRKVLIDGKEPDPTLRFSGENGLVAQITQNMNFVIDLCVEDFLHMHAESRSIREPDAVVHRVMESAVGMAGEPFGPKTQITQLSGGQSRALMIADAAFLSPKPVVLIDEIENAGVNRTSAMKLFVEKGKIVLLSTHDPLLALSGSKRLVIRNGGVADVIGASVGELRVREKLALLDSSMSEIRERIRRGETIADTDLQKALAPLF